MKLEIVSPEAVLLQADVESVAVPGINGDFQMLENHAPVVSLLQKGNIKIYGNFDIDESFQDKFTKGEDNGTWLAIDSGTIEMNENKIIILVD
ncbi:MAG TPA: F0F1 ATP synthase subunit epsilon [Flavobacteriaceae bacterium]|nr:F0F1 ATP synthase subunit epsilon [Flavobacteriaceae bacterium]HIP27213.1 F0F1 ATP synthase subunit epsilon [Flavobacteriaceae bacterium]